MMSTERRRAEIAETTERGGAGVQRGGVGDPRRGNSGISGIERNRCAVGPGLLFSPLSFATEGSCRKPRYSLAPMRAD
jgi:hypothetical protein